MALQDIIGSLGNTPGYNTQLPRFSPESQGLQNLAINQATGRLNNLSGNTPQFAPLAQQAMTNFNQQTVPSIAERFTRMGARGSSAFAQNLGAAGANLQENLAAQEQLFNERQQGRNDNLLGMLLNAGLQPSFENIYTPAQPGFATNIAPHVGTGINQLIEYLSKGAQGAATGASLGGVPGGIIGALLGLIQQYTQGKGQQPQNYLTQFGNSSASNGQYFPLQRAAQSYNDYQLPSPTQSMNSGFPINRGV